MIARPAVSPFTRTMRRSECAASREGVKSPSHRDRKARRRRRDRRCARGLARHAERDLRIDDAGAGLHRVLGVALRRIGVEHRRRDAALRPEGGGAFVDAPGVSTSDAARRELQRAEEAGEAAADDEDGRRVSSAQVDRDGGELGERLALLAIAAATSARVRSGKGRASAAAWPLGDILHSVLPNMSTILSSS